MREYLLVLCMLFSIYADASQCESGAGEVADVLDLLHTRGQAAPESGEFYPCRSAKAGKAIKVLKLPAGSATLVEFAA